MITRRLMLATTAMLAAHPATAQLLPWESRQPPPGRKRIAILNNFEGPNLRLLFQAFPNYGWVEGRNLVIDRHYAGEDAADFERAADRIVALKPDLIVAPGPTAALSLATRTREIPIVIVTVSDPVAMGLAPSWARPGGNVTGLSSASTENVNLIGKRFQLLMELLPGISRIAYIGGRNNVVTGYSIPDVHAVQRLLGFTLIEKFLTSPDAIEPMAASLVEERVQGVVVQWDNFTSLQMQRIVDALNNARLPAMYNPRDFVDAGGLISYGARISDNYVRAAFYVNRILRGQKPGELPIEQPRYYDLVLNQKTADKLGITVPFTIYIRAEEILD